MEPVADLAQTKPAATQPDPLAELDNLIGFSRSKQAKTNARQGDEELPADVSRVVSKVENRSFRTIPRQRGKGIAIAAFGLVPMLFASGPGSEVQRPLAIVVIGGLLTSTALTLVLLPILFRRFGVKSTVSFTEESHG